MAHYDGFVEAERERYVRELEARIKWLNEGAILLMNVMQGRDINKQSAEYAVYERWRKRGQIIDSKEVLSS